MWRDERIVDGVLAGSSIAVARAITLVENGGERGESLLEAIYPASAGAHIVGITGIPGSGKSTLVARLVKELRFRGLTVGVIAVDPSSPYSGGAVLGDRVRMLDVSGDDGVFIRSMATHGALGGMSATASDAVCVLAASGKDVVVIETVGVGQDEVDISSSAHTTVVVSVPGTGDEVQALKAGVLEIADVQVVNKADRPGADRLAAQLTEMLHLGVSRVEGWIVPVLRTTAATGEGMAELCDVLLNHRSWLIETGSIAVREQQIAAFRIKASIGRLVLERALGESDPDELQSTITEVADRRIAPARAAERLLDALTDRTAAERSRPDTD